MIPRKTAAEIAAEIISGLESSFNTNIPLLRGFQRKLAKLLGMEWVTLYTFGGSILLQQFVQTAAYKDIKVGLVTINPLKFWGDIVDVEYKTGQRAELTVQISVLTQGGSITSGERIVNPKTQMVYTVVGDVDLDAATVTATIRATKVGAVGNVDNDTELQFVSATDDVEKAATVASVLVTGTDKETVEEYRERIRERFIAWPQGGAMADYKHWAEEVEGVRNAYPYSGWVDPNISNFIQDTTREGQVFVYIESSATDDGIPGETLRDEVLEHIENDSSGLAARRNINAKVFVLPISRTIFDVEVQGLSATDTAAARTAIESGMYYFMQKREPGGQVGYTILPPRKDIVSSIEVGGTAAKIAAAHGGTISGVTIRVNDIVDNIHYLQEGEKAELGTVTWT